jgi:hypothetical protein
VLLIVAHAHFLVTALFRQFCPESEVETTVDTTALGATGSASVSQVSHAFQVALAKPVAPNPKHES